MARTPSKKKQVRRRENYLDYEKWLLNEYNDTNKTYREKTKARVHKEFSLYVLCFFAFVYSYPVTDFASNPTIAVPAISLKLPLEVAITFFPTFVAVLYILYLSSVIAQVALIQKKLSMVQKVGRFAKEGEAAPVYKFEPIPVSTYRYFILPTSLHQRGVGDSNLAGRIKDVIEYFVGTIYVLAPFSVMSFLIYKAFALSGSYALLCWNTICLVVMALTFVSYQLRMKAS